MTRLDPFQARIVVNYTEFAVQRAKLTVTPLVAPEGGGHLVPDAARGLEVMLASGDLRRLGELLLALARLRELETDPPTRGLPGEFNGPLA
jgi:hypothetical protein